MHGNQRLQTQENRIEKNQHGNFVKPSLQEVVSWVKNSWSKITDSCGFQWP